VEPPDTRYARSGDLRIAYQVVGDGPIDLVHVPGLLNNLEAGWQEPRVAGFHERCARFSRLILFDRRGAGLSDRLAPGIGSSIEERIDDVRAVMDAVGSQRAAIYGGADGGPVAVVFAATYPERTAALVLVSTGARVRWAPDYPVGLRDQDAERYLARVESEWGTGMSVRGFGVDENYRRAFARMERLTGTPTAAAALVRAHFATDVRDVLAMVRVPTQVVHVRDHPIWPLDGARELADNIAGARLAEISGITQLPGFEGTDPDELPGLIEEFLTGSRASVDADRALRTVLFMDIVASTERAAELGDRRWREVLDAHDAATRVAIDRFRGVEVNRSGDGFLASFDGPARAIRCALAVGESARAAGLDVRAGVHTGECEVRGDDLAGIAVHIGARVCALAGAGEVLTTSTVRDLVAGSGIEFEDRGLHALKGVPDQWTILAARP
jgi:class 3 adenylate cyclase/pimeloyl-ACP methyl ester carboxylesterase